MTTVQAQQIQAIRRAYVTPQLVQFGSVSDLTASGSNGQKENNGTGSSYNGHNHP